jgi:3'-5' exonuclease
MQRICVFDLETVPDLEAGRALLGLGKDASDAEVRHAMGVRYAKVDQDPADAFVKVPMHKIVCIGALCAERLDRSMPWTVTRCGAGHIGQRSERELVSGFIDSLAGPNAPQLVGFNSSGFDLPIIRYRAFATAVDASIIHKANGRDYWYRYGRDHIDLCDVMSGFRASAPPSLAELAALCQCPVKIDGMDGSQVEPMVQAGRIADVAAYCETDIVATFLVFLRYALIVGELSPESYELSLVSLHDFLAARIGKRPHLSAYVETLSIVGPTTPLTEMEVMTLDGAVRE